MKEYFEKKGIQYELTIEWRGREVQPNDMWKSSLFIAKFWVGQKLPVGRSKNSLILAE